MPTNDAPAGPVHTVDVAAADSRPIDSRVVDRNPMLPGQRRARWELVLSSALMLFVELVLIRWTGAMVV